MINHIVLSVGSNCSKEEVSKALQWLESIFTECKYSTIYSTPAVQGFGKPYDNSVMALTSHLSIKELDHILKEYEKSRGRDSEARIKGIVPIDIDIVIFNNEIIRPRDYRQSFFQTGYRQLHEKSR